ncbi:thioredoxin [Candidatus Woesearchaeota archaeon]|nr:thioredoxin [Candidatus Woesearchaeota archaeon]
MNKEIDISKEDFEEKVLKSSLPVVVDFWGEGCGPCKAFSPIFDKVSKNYSGKVDFYKVNIGENMDLVQKYMIRSIPCIIFYKDGNEVKRFIGSMSEKDLVERVDSLCALE